MLWFAVMHVFSTLLDWLRIGQQSEGEKDLELLLLRHQLVILEQHATRPQRVSRAEKLTLTVIAIKLKAIKSRSVRQWRDLIRIVQPETIFKWHRELVRRKWTFRQPERGGRPRTKDELEALIVRWARENGDWGYGKIQGELGKLGYEVSEETIGNVLERHGIPPAPERRGSGTSCSTTKRRSWPAISSPSTPYFCRRSTCCSLSNSALGASTSRVARRIRMRPGLLNKPARWSGHWKTERQPLIS